MKKKSKSQDEYLKALLSEKDTQKVISHLVDELKRLRAMVRAMKEDQHYSREMWTVKKLERTGELPYIPLPGEHKL
jgi:DNA-binding phage protein|tara:strand:+ start:183 stop:410 length:228 start_codon:yes stop_codon:yes gene_type:complete